MRKKRFNVQFFLRSLRGTTYRPNLGGIWWIGQDELEFVPDVITEFPTENEIDRWIFEVQTKFPESQLLSVQIGTIIVA